MCPRYHLSFCARKTAWLAQEILVSIGPWPHLWFMHAKQWLLGQNYKSLSVPHFTCRLCMQNSVISTRKTCLYGSQLSSVVFRWKTARITSLCGSQTSPVVLCPQNRAISTWFTSLYGSQTSPVVLCTQKSDFRTRLICLYGFQTSSVVFSTQNSVLSTRVSRLYGFQPTPVVLWMQHIDFRTRITSLCGSQTPPVAFSCKTATSGTEQQVSMGPRHDLSFCTCTIACLASDLLVSKGRCPHLLFLVAKQRLLVQIYKSI